MKIRHFWIHRLGFVPPRVAPWVVALLVLSLPALAGEITEGSFPFGAGERTYSLAVPDGLTAGSDPVPLLIVLHGSGRDGRSLVTHWDRLAQKEGFLVVGPDAARAEFWEAGTDGPEMLRDLVDHLAGSYPVDRRRVYLFGHSAGAGFVLQMGLLESRYFAAAALHAGALATGTETWLPTKAVRKIPIHIAVGTRDLYFPLHRVRGTRDALEGAGIPVTLVEIPRHDHNYYGKSKVINRAAWEFLSGHALDSEPVFEEHRFE